MPSDGEFLGRAPMEEGEYFLKYMEHQRSFFKSSAKLIINFSIVDSEHDGRVVPRFYNVDIREPNDHSKQDWKPRPGSHMVRELFRLFADTYQVESVDITRIPIKKWFSAHLFVGEIVMVQKDAQGESIHPFAQQAKVKRLLRIETGKEGDDLTLPCLTLPSPSHPHLPEKASKVDMQRDRADWLGQKDKADLGILPKSEDQKLIEKLINEKCAETGEDVERLTNGRISADQARELDWFLE